MSLCAENVGFAYLPADPVLRGVTVEAQPGRVVLLFGPNGCGKSTLLRCLNGGLRPQHGHVRLDGEFVGKMDPRERARGIAVVPQEERQDIPFRVAETVLLGRHPHGDADGAADRRAAIEAMERLELLPLADRRFSQLSGGERQRVLIARALAQGARVLLLDEPAAHLDFAHQLRLLALVRRLADEGKAVLMAAHDVVFAPTFADECVLLSRGAVVARGRPDEVLAAPRLETAYGRALAVEWRRGEVRVRFDAGGGDR